MLRMLGILTARVMIGPSAPRDDLWVTLTTDYVQTAIRYCHSLKAWPSLLRPVVYRFLPDHKEIERCLEKGRGMIVRTIKDFDDNEATGVGQQQPTSVLYGMSRKKEENSLKAIERHLKEQMNLAVGGIHTTSAVLTQTLFELTAHPEYISPLRAEVVQAMDKCGGSLTKANSWEMYKLDSFIREAHRLNSPNLSEPLTHMHLLCRSIILMSYSYYSTSYAPTPGCAINNSLGWALPSKRYEIGVAYVCTSQRR